MKKENTYTKVANNLKYRKTEWTVYINGIKNRSCSDALKQETRAPKKMLLLSFKGNFKEERADPPEGGRPPSLNT